MNPNQAVRAGKAAGALFKALVGLLSVLFTLLGAVDAEAQEADEDPVATMSPPRIMVIPGEVYCATHGYTYDFAGTDGTETRPDYKRAILEDTDLHPVLSQIKELIMERNSKMKIIDLLSTVQDYENTDAMNLLNAADESEAADEAIIRNADADVLIKVNYDVVRNGPRRQVQLTIIGTDAYTGQEFAPVSVTGSPSTSVSTASLVREAVYSKMDDFLRLVLSYYSNMQTDGRAVSFYFKIQEGSEVRMNTVVTDYTLAEVIEDKLYDQSVGGQGIEQSQMGETFLSYRAVHIPLMGDVRGRLRRQSALHVAQRIAQDLEQDLDLTCTCKQAGLGKVYVYIQ